MTVLSNLWQRLEKLLAALLIGLSLIHAGQYLGAMATTSLSTDEFGTVSTFSSRGPGRVMTDYRAPKNHIFFNLLNSVLPARDSLHPGRARLLSILATVLTAGLVIAYVTWRDRLMEGAILLALWSLGPQMLELSMEARGYGFLGLFATGAAIGTLEFLRSGRRAWLWAAVATSVLGVYTIPSFLFFAGPLLLALWAADRTRLTFFAGLGAAAAMLLLYSPVLVQLANAFSQFQSDAESDFDTPHGIIRSIKLYIFPSDDWEAWTFLAAASLAPFVLTWRLPRGERLGLMAPAAACVCYLAMLLVLKSPPVRVAAFCLLPLVFTGLLALGAFLRGSASWPVRAGLYGWIGITLLGDLVGAFRGFRFVPTEDWSLAGQALSAGFPEATRIDYKRLAKYLRHTVADAESRAVEFDPAAFARGDLVVVDASNKWAEGRQFTAPPGTPRAAEWTIPGTIRDIVISFTLPTTDFSTGPGEITDRDVSTGVLLAPKLTMAVTPPQNARSLVLFMNRPITWRDLMLSAEVGDQNLASEALVAGNGIVLPVSALAGKEIRLHLEGYTPGLRLTEAWFVE